MPFNAQYAGSKLTNAGAGSVDWTFSGLTPLPDATCALPGGAISYQVAVYDFSFALPAGATIDGILVQVDRYQSAGTGTVKDYSLQLNGTGDDKADTATAWPGSSTAALYGGSSDLWGQSWTAAGINGGGLVARLAAKEMGLMNAATARAVAIQVTVYYTPSPGMLDEDEGLHYQTRTLYG